MKRITMQILLILLAAAARANTTLIIDNSATQRACLDYYDEFFGGTVNSTFTLSGVSGSGVLQSSVTGLVGMPPQPLDTYAYTYTLDLSGMSTPASHCIRLLMHFGTPESCEGPAVLGDPNQIQSATLAPYGDITFVFGGGCLQPGQAAVNFSMISQTGWKTNLVDIIDDYYDPASGHTNETFTTVKAIVPDIAPDPTPWWATLTYLQHSVFQGQLSYYNPTSSIPMLPVTNGDYDVLVTLLTTISNTLSASPSVTNRIQISQAGLFTVPLPGEPVEMGDGSARYVSIAVRKAGGTDNFSQISPPMPITPTPQALYALSAGTVADLAPGQAVTSLNGLTDTVNLQAGSGILLGTNGNALVITAQPGVVSDQNLKTDFANVQPESILTRLAALRIQAWRYTNEIAGVWHVGPMAQDFKAAFGLGNSDKFIGFVDEQGVALAAIQGLNEKVESGKQKAETQIEELKVENAELKARLEKLEQLMDAKNAK